MDSFITGILYSKNRPRFEQIKNMAAGFVNLYIGHNIIQDDIFTVIENYAETKKMPLEWIRIPIEDEELCACTFVRGGRIFVVLIILDVALRKTILNLQGVARFLSLIRLMQGLQRRKRWRQMHLPEFFLRR